MAEKATIVSADEIKKTFPNYSPQNVEALHSKSAKIADRQFYSLLNKSQYRKVYLLNGGAASGKTEFVRTQLENKKAIIFDGTMPSIAGARIRIEKSIKFTKIPEVFAVIPDDLNRAFLAFLNRDRKYSDIHFYRTHSKSRESLLWVANKYPDLKISIIESAYNKKDKLQFAEIVFNNRNKLVQYLENIQLSEDDIINLVN